MAPAVAPVRLIARAVPWFVIGFVLLATLRSLGLLDGDVPTGGTLADLCSTLATALILVALAGVGISTDLRAMLAVGARPFLLGASIWILIATLAFLLAAALPADGGSVRVAAVAGYHGG